jgi:hypothetical protein
MGMQNPIELFVLLLCPFTRVVIDPIPTIARAHMKKRVSENIEKGREGERGGRGRGAKRGAFLKLSCPSYFIIHSLPSLYTTLTFSFLFLEWHPLL